MKRLSAAFLLFFCAVALRGQTLTTVQVFADQEGARFVVDGAVYDKPAAFLWAIGSAHVLSVILPNQVESLANATGADAFQSSMCAVFLRNLPPGTQTDSYCTKAYTFLSWADSTGKGVLPTATSQTITLNPGVTFYRASFSVQNRLRLMLSGDFNDPLPDDPAACADPYHAKLPPNRIYPGLLTVNGTCYWNSIDLWFPQGALITFRALPYYGWTFQQYYSGVGALASSSVVTLKLDRATTITPIFERGKPVRFRTDPPGLPLLIDRTPINTLSTNVADDVFPNSYPVPGLFFWKEGSQHILASESPVNDTDGNPWFFDSFSNGMGLNAVYTARDVNAKETITAKFKPGAYVKVVASPDTLRLKVDGRDNWSKNMFTWALDSKHQLVASAEQTDPQGRKYKFKSWSNGGAAAQEFTAADTGGRLTTLVATYELMSRFIVQATPPGVVLKVDGSDCRTPCTIDRLNGETVHVVPPATIPASSVERSDFDAWSDGAPLERDLTVVGALPYTLSLSYKKLYLLRTSVEPSSGAELRVLPGSPDGFYAAGSQVSLALDLKPGFRVIRWEGDLSGASQGSALTMDGPKLVRVVLDAVPHLADGGIGNAAGETPEAVVAPGSLIAIFGGMLAPDYLVGPASPLAQTLGGVTVRIKDRLLPLLFVSPEQINALLPSDLAEGEYHLTVRSGIYPEIGGTLTVVRNAPGLFTRTVDSQTLATALHADGTLVAPDSPARKGEVISLLGTGFGPFKNPVPDGFAVPQSPAFPLADGAEVFSGERQLETLWTGAAPGLTGIVVTRVKIPDDAAAGAALDIVVRINGRASNQVQLPVE